MSGKGIPEHLAAIEQFKTHTNAEQGKRRRARAEWRMRELLGQRFLAYVEQQVLAPGELDGIFERIAGRQLDPYTAVDDILRRAKRG
jgi:putative protein kinase ArgK-like GTPase of G3E family